MTEKVRTHKPFMTVTDTVEGGVKVVSPLGPRFRIETTTGRPYSNLFGDPET